MSRLQQWPRRLREALGQCLHQFNGGAAYQHYLDHLRSHHPDATPLSADDFHRREQQRRWDGIRRCC